MNNNDTIVILGHEIEWYYKDEYDDFYPPDRLPDSEEEYISKMIAEGHTEGELCYFEDDIEFRGWWKTTK